jgi:signal peptidase I
VSAASAFSPYPIDQESPRGASTPAAQPSVADKVRVGGSATIRVVATSMFPWIRSGDQAFIRRFDFAQINSGDVILYERANRLFIHRVIRRITRPSLGGDVSLLVVKGDALDRPDAPVSAKEFLGRAIRIHRGKRHIDLQSSSQTLLGKLLAGVSGLTRFVYGPLRSLRFSNSR